MLARGARRGNLVVISLFPCLEQHGAETIRTITMMTSHSPMSYGSGTRSVSSWNRFRTRMNLHGKCLVTIVYGPSWTSKPDMA